MDTITCEPESEYCVENGNYLTSDLLADFRHCPVLYRRRLFGLAVNENRSAYLIDRALRVLVFEGRNVFEKHYTVGGFMNPWADEPHHMSARAAAAWEARQGKIVMTPRQFELVERMAEGVQQQDWVVDNLYRKGKLGAVARADYCGKLCQARVDWFHEDVGIVQLKSCRNLDRFPVDARRQGHVHQAAFEQAVLERVMGTLATVYLIAVEKREPYRCGVWQVEQDLLNRVRRENEAAIGRLKRSLTKDTWPTGYEECRILE